MPTEDLAWPYSLMKRAKGYCLVQGVAGGPANIVASGGWVTAVTRTAAGTYLVDYAPDLQNDAAVPFVSSMASAIDAANATFVNWWYDITAPGTNDHIYVLTWDFVAAYELADTVNWCLFFMEPKAGEKLNDWIVQA